MIWQLDFLGLGAISSFQILGICTYSSQICLFMKYVCLNFALKLGKEMSHVSSTVKHVKWNLFKIEKNQATIERISYIYAY